ncbi:polysaccharide pyruvyl transferase family protein [Marinobacter sp. SS13-12]|uniref:polysaccharide pyruvyl transferase family protein n=1 Tax=Marinobacter sp. SS13-12 TaxID=3050451 RepID=UPI002553668F|nr:polysaccharide pyruvyl transferase family protein [Marinobacter sp. SS13-12]MDK8464278.1 polysaccharide pyruvyl transferase family protein [Marinobacter sp. SS13-12]
MALVYFDKFMERTGVGNFGDDINPVLMGRFFNRNILSSEEIALFGIGTILNDNNIKSNNHYARKVIFSSGVGYGKLETTLDDTWDIACVRGPGSARALGIGLDKAIADGAVLLSEMYSKPAKKCTRAVFIPHVNSHLSTGRLLAAIADKLDMDYLTPSCNADEFIRTVASAPFVVTEAMHGAILADTMRVPWIPVSLHEFHEFKWRDWMDSVGLKGKPVHSLSPKCWDAREGSQPASFVHRLYKSGKGKVLKHNIRQVIATQEPLLSQLDIIDSKKQALLEVVNDINRAYSRI